MPKVALLSHSNFGSRADPSAQKMSRGAGDPRAAAPNLEVEGEMHGDAALSEEIRLRLFPNSRLKGEANLLIMPTLDAANISFNLLKMAAGDGITVGPILLGAAKTGAHPDADRDGAAPGQHDRAGVGGCLVHSLRGAAVDSTKEWQAMNSNVTAPVVFEERTAANGARIGVARLNAEKNAQCAVAGHDRLARTAVRPLGGG